MTRASDWKKDPEGHAYRIDLDSGTVKYRRKDPKPPIRTLFLFLVSVRNEQWRIWAPDAEYAASLFMSQTFPHYPKRGDIKVEAQ